MELPKSANDVREFIGTNFSRLEFGQQGGEPCLDDVYLVSAHDILSAFGDLIQAHQDSISEPLNNGEKHDHDS